MATIEAISQADWQISVLAPRLRTLEINGLRTIYLGFRFDPEPRYVYQLENSEDEDQLARDAFRVIETFAKKLSSDEACTPDAHLIGIGELPVFYKSGRYTWEFTLKASVPRSLIPFGAENRLTISVLRAELTGDIDAGRATVLLRTTIPSFIDLCLEAARGAANDTGIELIFPHKKPEL